MATKSDTASSFKPLGQGVTYAVADNALILRIPLDSQGVPSSTGKMTLIGNTSGFKGIPESVNGLRANVMVGFKVPAKA